MLQTSLNDKYYGTHISQKQYIQYTELYTVKSSLEVLHITP